MLTVQGSFVLIFQTCIYSTLIKLTPSNYFLFFYGPAPLLSNSL
jgi:hypothetical protein